jgi:hypothetical protein
VDIAKGNRPTKWTSSGPKHPNNSKSLNKLSSFNRYSRILPTIRRLPGVDNKWRFCIDYRSLNDCTESASWPIPNIKEMFTRLGNTGSDTFGVMDLTSGYHQAPVSLSTQIFTAFITFCDIYQFTRFGPKRAPSYFQTNDDIQCIGGFSISFARCI